MHDLIVIWMDWVKAWEYLGVVILMAMESSIIPVPSEVVVPPAEEFMRAYATGGIFFSRFLPVIRHLISIPAGMARVNFLKFSISTITGSAIWCWVLAWFGDKVGRNNPALLDSPEELIAAIKAESHLIVLGVVLLVVLYAVMKYMTRPKNKAQDSADKAE